MTANNREHSERLPAWVTDIKRDAERWQQDSVDAKTLMVIDALFIAIEALEEIKTKRFLCEDEPWCISELAEDALARIEKLGER